MAGLPGYWLWRGVLDLLPLRPGPPVLQRAMPGKKRQQQTRAANQKHRKSEEGRLDHRDHQRAYRERCRLRVTDQPSAPTGSGSIVETEPSPAKDGPGSGSEEARYAESAESEPACIICGRTLGPAPSRRPSFPDGG